MTDSASAGMASPLVPATEVAKASTVMTSPVLNTKRSLRSPDTFTMAGMV